MSTPGNEFRESEYLGLGFLAVSSSELIEQLLADKPIDDDEKYTLERARSFLLDVASGARLVTSGISAGASATDSIRKLAYSVEPLKLMQDAIHSAEVETAFEGMASSINSSLTGVPTESEREYLVIAKEYFSQLYIFLAGLVETSKRRTGLDSSFSAQSLSYA